MLLGDWNWYMPTRAPARLRLIEPPQRHIPAH